MSNQQIGIRRDIAEMITSAEADRVTSLMTNIYYRLIFTPPEWWVSSNILRIRGGVRGGAMTTAWAELVGRLGVSPEVAKKALKWMDEKEIIHYRVVKSGREIEISFEGLFFTDS